MGIDLLVRGGRGPRLIGRSCWLLLILPAALAGCGDSNAYPKVSVYPVKGQVNLASGKPLAGGYIYFVPTGDLTISPNGPISTDGTFSLATGDLGEGAPEGTYKVRIDPPPVNAPATNSSRPQKLSRPFAFKYTDEDSSGLTATVKPEPNQLPSFVLK